jgi:hypothetical protein
MALRGEVVPNEMNAVMNTVGNGWFDKDWRPTFNVPRDVEAIETYKRLAKYTVAGIYRRAYRYEDRYCQGQYLPTCGTEHAREGRSQSSIRVEALSAITEPMPSAVSLRASQLWPLQ